MFSLILMVAIALGFGYFATQNTIAIPITIGSSTIQGVPLYVVLGIILLIGLFLSWLISLLNSISSTMKLRGKEHTIKDAKQTINELTKQVNELQIENAKFKGELSKDSVDDKSL